MSTPVYLTINQVADRLQVEHRTVRKAIRIGRLEAFKIFQQWRISEAARVRDEGEQLIAAVYGVILATERRATTIPLRPATLADAEHRDFG